jgi:UDP-N-acetylmuramyl pentapeptide phosphotransferase/UDP-N-acetylglucosamine-1-phosphate transferase
MSRLRTVAALAVGDRWLLTFIVTVVAVLFAGGQIRRVARVARARSRAAAHAPRHLRRRAGALIALGPVVGLAISPTLHEHALVAAVGGAALAIVGWRVDRTQGADRVIVGAVLATAAIAAASGVALGPTGVDAFDVVGGFAVITLVTLASDGLGDADGLAAGVGLTGGLGLLALAGFAEQDSLATVAAGLAAASLAFLAFNLRPASLFAGRGGRLAIGYVLGVGALSVRLPVGPSGRLIVPVIFLGVFLIDAAFVLRDRLLRRQSLVESRADHLRDRLARLGWPPGWSVGVIVIAQLLLALVAVFAGRGVLPLWLGFVILAVVVAAFGSEAARATFGRGLERGYSRRVHIGVGVALCALVLCTLPTALAASDVQALMEHGRASAVRALAAARNGDQLTAELNFHQAAAAFDEASNRLDGATLTGGLFVPGLAPNLRAARTLAAVGRDLAHAGERVTGIVDPSALEVVDGRLPLEEVRRVAPALRDASRTLDSALARLRSLDDPYLLSFVTDTLARVEHELARSAGEAKRGADAAELAPALFGGDGRRTYLLVVQNNAELRATGGLIGSWGLLTADDGRLSLKRLERTVVWNEALAALARPATIDAPADFHRRYDSQGPERGLQADNLTPDFSVAARVLTSLAPQIGLPQIDGVLAVDPLGLAALLELTGPVRVQGWPENITAANVVDVTLRDAYAAFVPTPQRAEFLGDVAHAVLDQATSGRLGQPARIAKVLGAAAHEGHIQLELTRPREERLARELSIDGDLGPVRSDALTVNTQNAGANKIDFYLRRDVDYRVVLHPDAGRRTAFVTARLRLQLDNTAPDSGLPQIVIGPYRPGFIAAGVNRSWISVYTPLEVTSFTVNGAPVPILAGRELGRHVYSRFEDIPAKTTRTVELTLEGRVRLTQGGWYQLDLGHQPTLTPDRVQVSVTTAPGWEIDRAPGMIRPFDRRATVLKILTRPQRLQAQLAERPSALDLWGRLQAGK